MIPFTFAINSNDFWKQLPFKIDQQMACKMECLILPPFEAPQRPTMSQDAPKTASWLPKTHPKRPQDGSKTPPRRTTTPCGWSQLRPAAPKAAKKPSKPRFWTLWTSILDPPDLDFWTILGRFLEDFWTNIVSNAVGDSTSFILFVLARWRVRSFAALLDFEKFLRKR